MVQKKLQDDAGGNRNQNIVPACLNPMVTTGRGAQVVAAPVIDHILPVMFSGREAIALVVCMVRACAAFIVARGTPVIRTIILVAALRLFIAAAIVAVIALGVRKSSRGQ